MTRLSYYKKKTVLVTGSSGYIGSAVVGRLGRLGCRVVEMDRKTDIADKRIWKKLLARVDIVFHFAAQTSSQFGDKNMIKDIKINLLSVVYMVDSCKKYGWRPDIIFSGTVTQAGLTKTYLVNEKAKDEPITIYDINKLAAEKYLQFYSKILGGRAVTLRLANVYGPGKKTRRSDRGVLNKFIKAVLKGKDLTIYGKGNYVRDYIFIDDVVGAFLTAGVKMGKVKGRYYVIGSGKGYTIKEAASLVCDRVGKKTGKKVKVVSVLAPDDMLAIEKRNFVADSSLFSKLTGWRAKVTLTSGIDKTMEHFEKGG